MRKHNHNVILIFMKRKINIIYLLALLVLTVGVSSCSSSSKRVPDFTGIYKGSLGVDFYNLEYPSKIYLKKSPTNDPYKLDMVVLLNKGKNEPPIVYKFNDIIVDAKTATDDSFIFRGHQKDVDFGVYGIGDLTIKGKSESKALYIDFLAKVDHKDIELLGEFYGGKLNRKESSEAEVHSLKINDPAVFNVEVNAETLTINIHLKRDINEEYLKQLKYNIEVSKGADYTQSTTVLDLRNPMKIKVISEDMSTEKEYQVVFIFEDKK